MCTRIKDYTEILDVEVTLVERGFDIMIWQNPTRAELNAILEHVIEMNAQGKKLEKFSIEHHFTVCPEM